MNFSQTLHIQVEKGTPVDEFIITMKNAFIQHFGEDSREQINEDLMCHLIGEYIAQHGIKQTEQYLDDMKMNARKAHQRTLH